MGNFDRLFRSSKELNKEIHHHYPVDVSIVVFVVVAVVVVVGVVIVVVVLSLRYTALRASSLLSPRIGLHVSKCWAVPIGLTHRRMLQLERVLDGKI